MFLLDTKKIFVSLKNSATIVIDSLDKRFFVNTFVSAEVWELAIFFKISSKFSKNKNQSRCCQHFLFLNSGGKYNISKDFSNLSYSLQDNKEGFKWLKITWWSPCIVWAFTERENVFFLLTWKWISSKMHRIPWISSDFWSLK